MCVFTWKTKKWQTCYFNNFVKTQIEIWAKHIFIATSSFFLLFAWLGIPCASARKTVCALWQNMGCFYFATYTWNISQECRVLDSCAIYQAQYWFDTRKQEGSSLIKPNDLIQGTGSVISNKIKSNFGRSPFMSTQALKTKDYAQHTHLSITVWYATENKICERWLGILKSVKIKVRPDILMRS